MTFYSKVGHYNNTTSGTSDTISSIGFQPQALIMWAGNQSATGWQANVDSNVMFSIGFSANNASGMQYGSASYAGENDVTMQTMQYKNQAAYPLILYNYLGTLLLQISSISFTSSGFTATYSATPSAAYTIYYLAIGGTDITGVGVTAWDSNTTTGNQSVTLTGTSFKPTCVLHLTDINYSLFAPFPDSSLMLGAMDSAGNQWSNNIYSINGDNLTNSGRLQVTDACIIDSYYTAVSSGILDRASFVSMDANGFTVDWTVKNVNAIHYYSLALEGINCVVGHHSKTGQKAAITETISGLGFTPAAVIATTDSYPASAAIQEHSRFTLGASDGANQGVLVETDESDITLYVPGHPPNPPMYGYTVLSNYNDSTNTIIVSNSTAGFTTDVAAQVKNFSFGQFQIVWGTDTTTEATQVCYVAFGGSNDISVTLTAPTATTSTNPPSQDVAPILTKPTGTTATYVPTQSLATTLVTPTATTVTYVPAVITPSGIIIALTAPTATTDTYATTQAIIPPTLTAPTATTATHAASPNVAPTLIMPSATTTISAMSQAAIATILLRAPTATTATNRVIIPHRRKINIISTTCAQLEPVPLRGTSKNIGTLTAIREKY